MKKTLLTGLIATTMAGAVLSNVNALEIDKPVITSIQSKTKSVREAEPLVSSEEEARFVVNHFNYIYGDNDFIPAHVQLVEDIARQAKAYQEELAELERQRLEEERRIAEEYKIELARKESVTFNAYDVTQKSYVTEHELIEILKNTTSGDGLIPYASYFVEAEQIHGINTFFICAIAAQESGWGKYRGGNGTNLTGYAVYSSSHTGTTFSGVRENILATAELIAKNYTAEDGKYRTVLNGYGNGKSVWEINQRYCLQQDQKTPDMNWSTSLNKIANGFNETYHSLIKNQ